jgi:ABC-type amino acid transport system permease subunit
MNRRTISKGTLSIILAVVSLALIGYAIYRSTDVRQIVTGPGTETVYGEPQHGLILGLCIIAGICLLGIVLLFRDNRITVDEVITKEEPKTFTRTASNYPR